MSADFSVPELALLSACVFLAGVVDSLAGGGGLITLPAYLALGLDPLLVLGTNKLASSIGTTASVYNYQRKQKLKLSDLAPAVAVAALGGVLGARAASMLDKEGIRRLMLVMLPVLAAFLLTRRNFGASDDSARHGRVKLRNRAAALSLPIGVYDGFFGPGTGTFFALALTRFCGYDLLGATGRAKILNLTTNGAALAAFLWAGRVHYGVGLSMGAVSLCGHYAGSHLGLRGGAKVIRPVVAGVCLALFLKLLLQ